MQHSHEALDRPGGLAAGGLLTPLRHRDFRLLWSGMCVSLMGDGIFLVAMAWQVYGLSNAPSAMIADCSATFSPVPTNDRSIFRMSTGKRLR